MLADDLLCWRFGLTTALCSFGRSRRRSVGVVAVRWLFDGSRCDLVAPHRAASEVKRRDPVELAVSGCLGAGEWLPMSAG